MTRNRLVTGALIAAAALPAAWLLGLWSSIAGWLELLASFLAAETLVPNWMLALLALCAIIVAGWFGASLRPTRESTDPDKDESPP
jgi:hypothetical protein